MVPLIQGRKMGIKAGLQGISGPCECKVMVNFRMARQQLGGVLSLLKNGLKYFCGVFMTLKILAYSSYLLCL